LLGNNPGCFAKKGRWVESKLVFSGDFAYAGMTIRFHDETTANAAGSVTMSRNRARATLRSNLR
jgi:hypothetical protein